MGTQTPAWHSWVAGLRRWPVWKQVAATIAAILGLISTLETPRLTGALCDEDTRSRLEETLDAFPWDDVIDTDCASTDGREVKITDLQGDSDER